MYCIALSTLMCIMNLYYVHALQDSTATKLCFSIKIWYLFIVLIMLIKMYTLTIQTSISVKYPNILAIPKA